MTPEQLALLRDAAEPVLKGSTFTERYQAFCKIPSDPGTIIALLDHIAQLTADRDYWKASGEINPLIARVRATTIEECAKAADAIATDAWNLYKGRPPYTGREPGRADTYQDGRSDGAGCAADAIRALAMPTAPNEEKPT